MKFSVLASGSTGNAIYVEANETRLLIDIGISRKQLEAGMEKIAVNPEKINAIFITHEHIDHIKGIGIFARKYRLPIYANEKTWQKIFNIIKDIPSESVKYIDSGEIKEMGDIQIEPFAISHDAVSPMGYCFYHGKQKLGLSTDLGYVSKKIKEKLHNADALIFEANHNIEMLRMSHYPWHIKQRILSDVGHLSNELAGEALTEIIADKTKRVVLAHLSKDNNTAELAHLTVEQILNNEGICTRKTQLSIAHPVIPTPLYDLDFQEKENAQSVLNQTMNELIKARKEKEVGLSEHLSVPF